MSVYLARMRRNLRDHIAEHAAILSRLHQMRLLVGDAHYVDIQRQDVLTLLDYIEHSKPLPQQEDLDG